MKNFLDIFEKFDEMLGQQKSWGQAFAKWFEQQDRFFEDFRKILEETYDKKLSVSTREKKDCESCQKKNTCEKSTCKSNFNSFTAEGPTKSGNSGIKPVTLSSKKDTETASCCNCNTSESKCKITTSKLDKAAIRELIIEYDKQCFEVIRLIPTDNDIGVVRATLKAYFILAVLLNKFHNVSFMGLYKEVFEMCTHEYMMPSIRDVIFNNYDLFSAFTKLENKIHEVDNKWIIDTREISSTINGKVKLEIESNILDKNIRFTAQNDNFELVVGNTHILIDSYTTIRGILFQVLTVL